MGGGHLEFRATDERIELCTVSGLEPWPRVSRNPALDDGFTLGDGA
jgi:hypothetical protein